MSSTRELLEAAVPVVREPGPPAAEVRELGRRRARRSRAVGALAGTVGLVVCLALGAQLLRAPDSAPAVGPAPSPSVARDPLAGPVPDGLVGSVWVVALGGTVAPSLARLPGDPGSTPSAVLRFDDGHRLTLVWQRRGGSITVSGRWELTTRSAGPLSTSSGGALRLTLSENFEMPLPLQTLAARLETSETWAAFDTVAPERDYLTATAVVGIGAGGRFLMYLVRPGAVVPAR
ncbi:MAG: hypothetical protein GC157_05295 [Frankiales bacterium]|nr:hypothetical protein [Frankiales bacterium]